MHKELSKILIGILHYAITGIIIDIPHLFRTVHMYILNVHMQN